MRRTSPKAGEVFYLTFSSIFLFIEFYFKLYFFSGFLLVRMMKSSYIRKALLVGCLIQLFQQAAGINTGCYKVFQRIAGINTGC
jgi:hypothetical protein